MSPEAIEQEKQFIAQFSDQQHPLPPEEVLEDPRSKQLGHSSKALGVRDFELVRTLGTGIYSLQSEEMGIVVGVRGCTDCEAQELSRAYGWSDLRSRRNRIAIKFMH